MSCVNKVNVPVCGMTMKLDPDKLNAQPGVGALDFSTAEQWTGQHWVDGKKLYQKTMVFNVADAVGNISHEHGIQNFDTGVDIRGIYIDNGGKCNPLTSFFGADNFYNCYFDATVACVRTSVARNGTIHLTMQYTCTDR